MGLCAWWKVEVEVLLRLELDFPRLVELQSLE